MPIHKKSGVGILSRYLIRAEDLLFKSRRLNVNKSSLDLLILYADDSLSLNQQLFLKQLNSGDVREFVYYLIYFQFPDLWRKSARRLRKERLLYSNKTESKIFFELMTKDQLDFAGGPLISESEEFDVENAFYTLSMKQNSKLNLQDLYKQVLELKEQGHILKKDMWIVALFLTVLQHYNVTTISKVLRITP